ISCIIIHALQHNLLSLLALSAHSLFFFSLMRRPPPTPTLFPYTTLFRSGWRTSRSAATRTPWCGARAPASPGPRRRCDGGRTWRSEEHTSELQSRFDLVCRLLLEKKKKKNKKINI